jgi:hypothetical protein
MSKTRITRQLRAMLAARELIGELRHCVYQSFVNPFGQVDEDGQAELDRYDRVLTLLISGINHERGVSDQ